MVLGGTGAPKRPSAKAQSTRSGSEGERVAAKLAPRDSAFCIGIMADVAGGCFITLVALSTLVNSVIIVQFLVKRKYKMSHHMTYLNLAVADLCISVYGTVIRGPGEYYLKT